VAAASFYQREREKEAQNCAQTWDFSSAKREGAKQQRGCPRILIHPNRDLSYLSLLLLPFIPLGPQVR